MMVSRMASASSMSAFSAAEGWRFSFLQAASSVSAWMHFGKARLMRAVRSAGSAGMYRPSAN